MMKTQDSILGDIQYSIIFKNFGTSTHDILMKI